MIPRWIMFNFVQQKLWQLNSMKCIRYWESALHALNCPTKLLQFCVTHLTYLLDDSKFQTYYCGRAPSLLGSRKLVEKMEITLSWAIHLVGVVIYVDNSPRHVLDHHNGKTNSLLDFVSSQLQPIALESIIPQSLLKCNHLGWQTEFGDFCVGLECRFATMDTCVHFDLGCTINWFGIFMKGRSKIFVLLPSSW